MPRKDWTVEADEGRMPTTAAEMQEMSQQMEEMGLKGAYNPMNHYPGSPFTPSEFPEAPETLRKIVERHSETLEKRWAKKTKKKQKELLLQAWPNMSATHRPDYEAFRVENTGPHHKGLSKFQEAYKWPYINQQDLSSKSLTIFITSRGRHPPIGHFIPEPAFLQGYTLFMDGETPDTYGKLVSWDGPGSNPEAANLMLSHRKFTPGEGLQVLELQQKVYPFLIKCCELILHDFAQSGSLLDDKFPIIPETAINTETASITTTEILPSLASISVEAPYRLPANLDWNRLRGILAARLSAAEDHLWALREDPGYFAETVKDWSEHRNDSLPDTFGYPHPTGPHTTEFWTRVIRNVIADAYSGFETWALLLRQVNRLRELKDKYKDEIVYETQLPEEYLIAILKLEQLLKVICEFPLHDLKNVQSSPPLRHWFRRAPQDPNSINMLIVSRNPLEQPLFHKPWGLLLILWNEPQRNLFGITNLIDAFEQIMQDPDEKRNLSPYIANLFSDLAILTRALHEIEIYQPWAATFEEEYEKHALKAIKVLEEATWLMTGMDHMDRVLDGITHLGMPGDGKFAYPVDKKRTQQNTEKMIIAEQNLDLFWKKFDANYRKLAGKSITACMGDHTPRQRENGQQIERTQPWVEPIKEPKADTTKEPKPWSDSATKDDKTPIKSKQKVKTKGAAIEEATPESEPTLGDLADKQPKFQVDKSTLKVFNTLFFVPGQTSLPGEITWVDFLRAMASTGFAAQKLYGSIWQFTPTKLDVERNILFHEPHPAVKIRFPVARRMGRQLTRAYGWHSGMFVLEEKKETKAAI